MNNENGEATARPVWHTNGGLSVAYTPKSASQVGEGVMSQVHLICTNMDSVHVIRKTYL